MTHAGSRHQILNGDRQRAQYGCIVSFENADGKTLVIHRPGSPRQGLRDACDIALKLDPTFRVVSYSTPNTIHEDLQGARESNQTLTPGGAPQSVEKFMCALAGRSAMLSPRISR